MSPPLSRPWPPTRAFGATALATALAACTTVGPDFTPPAAPPVATYTRSALPASFGGAEGSAAQALVAAPRVAPDWWTSFGSPRLDALVAQALRNSATLAAAEATLRQAEQLYAAQAGATLYPTVAAKLGASRNGTNAAATGQKGETTRSYNLVNASVGVSYNFDLFGANRRALEALAAQADAQRYQLAGARLTLAANVVTTAITQAQLGAQIEATEAILRAQQAQVEIARKRFELGAVAKPELLTLQTQFEQTRAGLPPLRNARAQAEHLLALLAGQAPAAADIPDFKLAEFTLPAQLPLVLPSALARQRPDIQASTALLHAATAQYGVAVSNLYPQISLSASLGSQALSAGALFGPGSMVWSLAGQLAQPLFNAGLKSGANAAEAALQAAGANYRQTVLQALRNVADALRALDEDAQTLQAQAAADASAQAALELVTQQNRLGAASLLQLLVAQQQAQQARLGLIAAQGQRLTASAALYQALGGGVIDASAMAPVATRR
jgi:NodT family efflux transporter outer membrane factor (OMF) lipoprotein